MSARRLLLSIAATLFLAAPALADGGPVPEPAPPPAPPPEPAPEYAPEPEPAPPPAEEYRYYLEGFGGVSFAPDLENGCCVYEMETGWNVGGAIGAHLNRFWDLELDVFYVELGYGDCADFCQRLASGGESLSALSLMVDLIYNFDTGAFVDPYLGAGFGATEVRYDGGEAFPDMSGSQWRFGYQFMGGLMFPLGDGFNFFAEYRYHDIAGDATIEGATVEYRSHNVSGGFRMDF